MNLCRARVCLLLTCLALIPWFTYGVSSNPEVDPLLCPPNTTATRLIPQQGTSNWIMGEIKDDAILEDIFKNNDQNFSPEDLFVQTGGVYLLADPVPIDGVILQIKAFGVVTAEQLDIYSSGVTDVAPYAYALTYTQDPDTNAYSISNGPQYFYHSFVPATLPKNQNEILNWPVKKGDRIGVFIPHECTNYTEALYCPTHVNLLTDEGECASAYFSNNSGPGDEGNFDVGDLNNVQFEEVMVRLNMEAFIMEAILDATITNTSNSMDIPTRIIASVTAVVIILVIITVNIIIVAIIVRAKRKTAAKINLQNMINDHFTDDRHEGYNVNAASLANFSQQNSAVEDYDYDSPYWTPADKKVELLSQFRKLMIHRILPENIEQRCILGIGAFGTVYKGVWSHLNTVTNQLMEDEVAVKTMENRSSEEDRIKFLQEAAIMGQFNHPNIVKILGITEENECIIMELMANRSLAVYLPLLKSSIPDTCELASQLLYYSRQVASGMSYLGLKGYVHRDLAARNVLVSEDGVCKIGDFGLSRDLNKEDFYTSHGGKIPVKWTAPEALHYRKYSTASDVWSYGCVLYEIWSLGVKPYMRLTNGEVIAKLSTGYRLPPPPGCPPAIYNIMMNCWNDDTDARINFCEICSTLNLPESKTLKWSAADVEKYSEAARTIGAPLVEGEELFTELQNTNNHLYLSIKL